MTSYRGWIALNLARAARADLETTRPHRAAVAARFAAVLGGHRPWIDALADEWASRPSWALLDELRLAAEIAASPAFAAAFADGAVPRVRRLILRPPRLLPRPLGLEGCVLPALATCLDLSDWLGITMAQLEWFAGPAQRFREITGRPHATRHYVGLLHPKRSGGWRLIEAPKPALKRIQRQLLDGLLSLVPVHEAAHGFVAGRSAASHAACHSGQPAVLHFDLRDFFPSIPASRVHALWRTLGYPVGVARALTTLTTARAERSLLERLQASGSIDRLARARLAAPHLPQGAPTSPAIANLCSFSLDLRLDGLAWSFGARYSRYADDLVFSGASLLGPRRRALHAWAAGIAIDEGHALHPRKMAWTPAHRRQIVGGIVVNQHPNAPRDDYDRLRALLHRCALNGPASDDLEGHADFRAHLRGRIAWVGQFSPARRAKLEALFARIAWPQ